MIFSPRFKSISVSILFAVTASFCAIGAQTKDTLAAIPIKKEIKSDSLVSKIQKQPEKTGTAKDTLKKADKPQGIVDTVYYSAEGGYIDYDVENKKMNLIHNASIRYQDITLNADTITYLIEDGLMIASGKPQLIEKKDTTVGESMIYNIKTKRGRVKYASAHMDEAYFNGTKIVKTEDNALYIDEGDYTTCAKIDTPDYFFYGQNIKVIPNKEIIGRPVIFALGAAPVAALPYFIFPLDRDRQSGILTPSWGGHPESGGYLDNLGYYWVPNDYLDVTAWARVSEFRDFVLNGSSRYKAKYLLDGSIAARYAYQGDVFARSDQWSIDYNHSQMLTPDGNFTLSGRGSLVGTQSFYRTFTEDSTELLNQTINANLSLSKRFTDINASLSANWNRNQNLTTNQISEDLPSLNFSLPSRDLFPFTPSENSPGGEKEEPAWYNKINYSYSASALRKTNSSPADTSQNFAKMGATQSFGISAPQQLFKWITMSPSFNAQLSTFDSYKYDQAYDTNNVTNFTYDTLTMAEKATRPVDSVRVVDTIFTQNFQTNKIDTAFKVIKDTSVTKIPLYHAYNKPANDFSWNAGVSLSTILYGMFPIKIFNFTGLRHVFTPSISYTYTPTHDLQKRIFYPVAPFAAQKDKQSQSVGINLSNEFQGKALAQPVVAGEKPVENKFQILTAGLSTAYDFEAPKRKFSDLSLNANTAYQIISVRYNSDFWFYDQNDALRFPILRNYTVTISPNNSLGVSGNFWEGDKVVLDSLQPKDDLRYNNAGPQKWSAGISPSYTFTQSRDLPTAPFVTTKNYSLSTSASCNFTRNWSMSWSSTYNFVTNQFVDHDIHFHYEQDCWELRFDWRPSGYNPGYYFLVNIKKIPEIKWENRG